MRPIEGARPDDSDRWVPTQALRRSAGHCRAINRDLLEASLHWLAAEADRTRLDAVIVVPSLSEADYLACVLPKMTVNELVAGNIVRMDRGSLRLMTPPEATWSTRQHVVILGLGLNDEERERVDRMNPAALCVVTVQLALGRV
jgi:hypothetical protein